MQLNSLGTWDWGSLAKDFGGTLLEYQKARLQANVAESQAQSQTDIAKYQAQDQARQNALVNQERYFTGGAQYPTRTYSAATKPTNYMTIGLIVAGALAAYLLISRG